MLTMQEVSKVRRAEKPAELGSQQTQSSFYLEQRNKVEKVHFYGQLSDYVVIDLNVCMLHSRHTMDDPTYQHRFNEK